MYLLMEIVINESTYKCVGLVPKVLSAMGLYRKVTKFSDARKLGCNLPKIQTKSPNFRVFRQKDANTIANSEDPDQTDPLGAV